MTTASTAARTRTASAAGSLCYAATFLAFGVKRDERRIYIAKATELARSRRRIAVAA